MALTDFLVHTPPGILGVPAGSQPYSPPNGWTPNPFPGGAGGFPAIGTTYVEPIFGQTIRRISNNGGGAGNSYTYNMNGIWNADGSALIDDSSGGAVNVRDALTGALLQSGVNLASWTLCDPINPDIVFHQGDGGAFPLTQLVKLNIRTGVRTVIATFASSLAGILGQSEDSQDNSGRYFNLDIADQSRVWDGIDANGRIPSDPAYAPLGGADGPNAPNQLFTGTTPSASAIVVAGGYWALSADAKGMFSFVTPGIAVWYALNLGARTVAAGVSRTVGDGGDHAGFVTAMDGVTYCVTVSALGNPFNAIVISPISQSGASVWRSNIPWPGGDEHFSGVSRGPLQNWCVVRYENVAPAGTPTSWVEFEDEVFMVNVLTYAVQRLAHSRERGAYYQTNRCSVNWDGTKVAFLSRYGFVSAPYGDTYVIDISNLAPGAPVSDRSLPHLGSGLFPTSAGGHRRAGR